MRFPEADVSCILSSAYKDAISLPLLPVPLTYLRLHACLQTQNTQPHLVLRADQQHACPGVEDGVGGGARWRAALRDLVLQVPDLERAGRLVQDRKPVAGNEHRADSQAALRLLLVPNTKTACNQRWSDWEV